MRRLLVPLLLTLSFWSGVQAQSLDGWQKSSRPAGYRHTWSGLFFPSKIEALRQLTPINYEPNGRNSAIGYNGSQHRLAITVYIYPKYANSMQEILSNELRNIQRAHPGMTIGETGRMKMPFGAVDPAPDTFGAFAIYDQDKTEVVSLLVLVPLDDKLLKVRATWMRSDEGMEYSLANVRNLLSRISQDTK